MVLGPITRAESDRNRSLLDEGKAIVGDASDAGLTVRLFGGAAIIMHCPSLQATAGFRALADLDVVVAPGQQRRLEGVMKNRGYLPQTRFNALHGAERMIFESEMTRVDVVVGTFQMCHRIQLNSRLELDHPTLPVTDLLLTKLQIVQLNEKDALDALRLLENHDVARTDGDVINLAYLDSLVTNDWGLWRTICQNLDWLATLASPAALERISTIVSSITEVPKGSRFKLRARVGSRVKWYQLPDEVDG